MRHIPVPPDAGDYRACAVVLARREMVGVLLNAANRPDQPPQIAAALRECAAIYEGTYDDVRD